MNRQMFLTECFYSLYIIGFLIIFPILVVYSIVRRLCQCLKRVYRKPNSIVGEVALVTGSARGLGREIAIELAKLGCHIAIVDIQEKLAEETAAYIAQTYGVKTKSYKINVTDYQQLLDLKERVTKDLGDVTILINNAGIVLLSSVENPTAQEIQRMINVNFMAPILTTQIFLPKMKQLNRGHIVNISSVASMMPHPSINVYAATKAALRQLTSSLRIDLLESKSNVTATTICPGFLRTNQRVNQLVKALNAEALLFNIEGNLVAQYVVEAMLRGEEELTVPRVLIYYARLVGIFPVFVLEKLTAVLTGGHISKKIDGEDFRNILKADDIPMNY